MPSSPSRTALLILVTGSLAAGLVLAEIVLRFLPEGPHPYMTSDPILHHRLLPNRTARVRGVELTTNSLGLRDREIAPQRSAGVFRILMLGDSFVEGRGLTLEQTVAKQAEGMLNHAPCAQRFEVTWGDARCSRSSTSWASSASASRARGRSSGRMTFTTRRRGRASSRREWSPASGGTAS